MKAQQPRYPYPQQRFRLVLRQPCAINSQVEQHSKPHLEAENVPYMTGSAHLTVHLATLLPSLTTGIDVVQVQQVLRETVIAFTIRPLVTMFGMKPTDAIDCLKVRLGYFF